MIIPAKPVFIMVGATGFEPATPSPPDLTAIHAKSMPEPIIGYICEFTILAIFLHFFQSFSKVRQNHAKEVRHA